MIVMRMVYKFRLFPTNPQKRKMERMLELCRIVYNKTLEQRKKTWEEEHKTLSKYTLNAFLPKWKMEYPELREVFSQTLQEVQERVDLAFKHFFRRAKNGENPGYPRFKGKGWYDSFCYPQMGFRLDGDRIYLGKIGMVYMVKHRPIEGDVKRVCVRCKSGKWYVCLTTEKEQELVSCCDLREVGIDVGLESFATLSNGEKIPNPRFLRQDEKALTKAQRKLSRLEEGTLERRKTRKVVGRIHERIGNRRYNFAHQLSHQLVSRFGFIAFEKLYIKDMVHNHSLAKSISDAAWRMLVTATQYKAESAGIRVVLVDPANTSKMCSMCGILVEKDLGDRIHKCNNCGLVLDRDENAAINILRLGLQSVGKTVEAHKLFQRYEFEQPWEQPHKLFNHILHFISR